MVGYLDWAQVGLRIVLRERPVETPPSLEDLAEELGIALDPLSVAERNEVIIGLDHVLSDPRAHGVVDYPPDGHYVGYSPRARQFRTEPLSATWPELRWGYMEADDEAFLVLAALEPFARVR